MSDATPRIHLCLVQPPGYLHSMALLDAAQYLQHQFRRLGARVTLLKNRLVHDAVNVVFGAHLGFDLAQCRTHTCVFVNLEQLGERGAALPPAYLDLLRQSVVIDYDAGNLAAYGGRADEVPLLQFGIGGHVEALDAIPLEERPIDLLFFGSMNERRQALIRRIEATGRSVEEASHQVRKLHDATQHISSVVAVINDVAEQTNLLALNAAIEAARAGEAGRGFAVVADAVRQLAERTAHSTREIGDTIAAVQQGVLATVENMRAVFSQTSNGITQARQGERVMLDIQQAVRLTQALVEEISAAVREENAAAQDMARRVEQVSRMAEDNHAAASASAGQAQRLQLQADDLQQVVGRYQLQD